MRDRSEEMAKFYLEEMEKAVKKTKKVPMPKCKPPREEKANDGATLYINNKPAGKLLSMKIKTTEEKKTSSRKIEVEYPLLSETGRRVLVKRIEKEHFESKDIYPMRLTCVAEDGMVIVYKAERMLGSEAEE